jgi:hypothetical protein
LKTSSNETKPAAGSLGMRRFAFAENKLGGMVYDTSGLTQCASTGRTRPHQLSDQKRYQCAARNHVFAHCATAMAHLVYPYEIRRSRQQGSFRGREFLVRPRGDLHTDVAGSGSATIKSSHRRSGRVCDRLDKAPGFIVEQSLACSHVKWLVSSRNLSNIKEKLELASPKVRLSLDLNADSVAAVVANFMEEKGISAGRAETI